MLNRIKSLFVEEEGQGMTEYGLVLGVIAIGVVATLIALRGQITGLISNISGKIGSESTDITTP